MENVANVQLAIHMTETATLASKTAINMSNGMELPAFVNQDTML